MDNLLSPSARKRLPVAIQKLSEKEQAVFVFLRMKRDGSFIAKEIDAPLPETQEMIKNVQNALVISGALDLVQNPVFYPIDQPAKEEDNPGRPFELPARDMDIVEQVALDRFYDILKKSLENMPKDGRHLLDLWFNKEMKAKEILNFYNNIGVNISSKKSINDTSAQDVFYELEKNIRKLLDIVRSNMNSEDIGLTPSALRAILDETGV